MSFQQLLERKAVTPGKEKKKADKARDEFIEKLTQAAVNLGFDQREAELLSEITVDGTMAMLIERNLSSEDLIKMVASKGGTTEAGLEVLRSGGSLKEATEKAYSSNIVMICAAGQKGYPQYPSSYPNLLSVGALTRSGELADFSCSGHIDVIGTSMISTHVRDNFIVASGGACAAAYAAGLFALHMNTYKTRPPVDVMYKDFIKIFTKG